MGESLTNSLTFYSDLLDNWEQTLERHYHHLTRIVRPHLFYGWLRAKGVFTRDDQEEVDVFLTTCLKAGRLIDLIKTKGKMGFVAFMEVIEYEYPEMFTEMTEKDPRIPPHEFCPDTRIGRTNSRKNGRCPASADVLTMIGDLTFTLTNALALKSEQLKKLNMLIAEMKMEHQQEAEDNASMYHELQAFRETIEELNNEKSRLEQRLRVLKDDRDSALQQCTQLREQKDRFMDQYHQLRFICENKVLMRTPSKSAIHEKSSQSAQKFVKPEYFSLRNGKSSEPAQSLEPTISWPVEEIGTLRGKLLHKKQKWKAEKESLMEQLVEYDQRLKKSAERWMESVIQIKAERDQVLQQNEDLNRIYSIEVSKNERLTSECSQYVEQFKRMEETIDNLKREIDQRNRQASKLIDRGILERMKHSHPTVEIDEEIVRFSQVFSTHESDNVSSTLTGSKTETGHKPLDRAHGATGSSGPFTIKQHDHLPSAALQLELQDRLKVGVCPFIVYTPPPERIQETLHSYLISQTTYFNCCPYDRVSANLSCMRSQIQSGVNIIHEKLSPDGKTCSRLTVENLRKCMFKGHGVVILPALPLTGIEVMRKQDIQPIVVVVKFRNEQQCCELTAIEEALDHHDIGLYETIEIDISLVNDFNKFISQVLNELLRLVEKYTFLLHCGPVNCNSA